MASSAPSPFTVNQSTVGMNGMLATTAPVNLSTLGGYPSTPSYQNASGSSAMQSLLPQATPPMAPNQLGSFPNMMTNPSPPQMANLNPFNQQQYVQQPVGLQGTNNILGMSSAAMLGNNHYGIPTSSYTMPGQLPSHPGVAGASMRPPDLSFSQQLQQQQQYGQMQYFPPPAPRS